jgi:YggT family protein
MNVLAAFGTFVDATRVVLLALAAVAGAVCLVDWAVRTRRLSPFGGVARFFRARVDPLMLPVERVVVRAGGSPSAAPWWSLAAVVVGGILLISLLGFVRGILGQVMFGFHQPGEVPKIVLSWIFSILRLALLVRVLSSWFGSLRYSKWVTWSFPLTEWMLAPLRRIVPLIGMIDITPLVAWFALNLLQSFLGIP